MSSPAEDNLSLQDVQRHMDLAIRGYGRIIASGQTAPILAGEHRITATDAVLAASAILDAVNLEVFELALWQSWGGDPQANSHGINSHDKEPGNA